MEADQAAGRPVVLVAEDEEDVRTLIVTQLEESGYEVMQAHDGDHALALVADRTPDLAILDVTMPGIDGYELTRRLRAEAATEELRIILLTASAGPRDVTQGFEVGADDYIKKPFSSGELRDRVQEILGR